MCDRSCPDATSDGTPNGRQAQLLWGSTVVLAIGLTEVLFGLLMVSFAARLVASRDVRR
jgi:hypothetical protein